MKQIYYTSCRPGFGNSISGNGGLNVRAQSTGFPPDVLGKIVKAGSLTHSEYLPVDNSPHRLRLAFLELNADRRAALHSVPVPAEEEPTGRNGSYFIHAVVGRAEEIDPLSTLRSWGSTFWKTKDDSDPTTLPDISLTDITPGSSFQPNELKSIVTHQQDMIEFVLTALLTTEETKIILTASPDVASKCLYATMMALPVALRSTITFSTYEQSPIMAYPRIVATWCKDNNPQISCPEGAVYFHTETKSALPTPPEFVTWAIKTLKSDSLHELITFHEAADTQEVKDGPALELLYRIMHSTSPLTPDDFKLPLLRSLAHQVINRPEIVELLLTQVVTNPTFLRDDFPDYVAALKSNETVRNNLVDQLWNNSLNQARQGNLAQAQALWTGPIPDLEPNFDFRHRLLAETKRTDFSKEIGLKLLLQLTEVAKSDHYKLLNVWLTETPPNELPELLIALKSAPTLRREVAIRSICTLDSPQQLTLDAIKSLADNPYFALDVVEAVPNSALLLAHLIQSVPEKPWATTLLEQFPVADPSQFALFDGGLSMALDIQKDLATTQFFITLVNKNGERTAELPLPETLVRLAKKLLDEHPVEWHGNTAMKQFLDAIARNDDLLPKLGEPFREKIRSRMLLEGYQQTPEFEPKVLEQIAGALRNYPDDDKRAWYKKSIAGDHVSERRSLFDGILDAIIQQMISVEFNSQQTFQNLWHILEQLGPVYAASRGAPLLLEELFHRVSTQELKKKIFLQQAFIRFAFIEANSTHDLFATSDIFRWQQTLLAYYKKHQIQGIPIEMMKDLNTADSF